MLEIQKEIVEFFKEKKLCGFTTLFSLESYDFLEIDLKEYLIRAIRKYNVKLSQNLHNFMILSENDVYTQEYVKWFKRINRCDYLFWFF